MDKRPQADTILVSLVNDVLIVGRKNTKRDFPDIINAFQGEEAKELYSRLVTKKGDA